METGSDGATARKPADSGARPLADYTVGWICATSTEYVAAQAFLDEKYGSPEHTHPKDNNDYTLGRAGKHNVVIAVLPLGEYGASSATGVAKDMLRSFHNLRIGLMVGIGGGAPNQKHDIRLGDVVVSAPGDGSGGVFQYDFGKMIQGQSFLPTGYLNQPPAFLRAAVNGLKAQYEVDGHQLEPAIEGVFKRKPRLRAKYSKPDLLSDILYQAEVIHPPSSETNCMVSCGTDPTKIIPRRKRTEYDDDPAIHYGSIASANALVTNATIRDKLSAEKGVLCFETEAAGLMNQFPCLVVRGICDYSDTHKHKEWQGYAAMTAAAYAKDLLCRLVPAKIKAEKKVCDILSGLHEVAEDHRDIAKEQLQIQKDRAKEMLSKEERECHRLFRLKNSSSDTTYEWYKARVEERVEGTCVWLLEHEHFQSWLKDDAGPLLVSADPGCGKSVLAKYLIDHYLPQSSTICYFFFKDQDQNTVQQALCAVLHQLFSQMPSLIKHAIPQYHKNGPELAKNTELLWQILRNAVKDSQAGQVIVVLDALDECAESEFANLVRNVESQFRQGQLGCGKIKYLLTCRPYERTISEFRILLNTFPKIHIPGEEESDKISQEVNRVITCRVNQLSEKKQLWPDIKNSLEEKLRETTHRTYLWVYLCFDYLDKEDFKKTAKGVEAAIATLPRSIDEAYEQILQKSKDHSLARKVLSIILAAHRPLTLAEMNVAVNVDNDSKVKSTHDLDLEIEVDFWNRLRSSCGLFISSYGGKIYFLHQTAREFLIADSPSDTNLSRQTLWKRSITVQHAQLVLAEVCVLYLSYFNSSNSLLTHEEDEEDEGNYALLNYASERWGFHFRGAEINEDASLVICALNICDSGSRSFSIWSEIFSAKNVDITNFTNLMVASYFGHEAIAKLLLDDGAEVDSKDIYDQTPLLWAAKEGHETIAKLLLDKGAEVDSRDNKYSQTPLLWAAKEGHEAIAKLLVDKGAAVNSKNSSGRTSLSWAAERGHETIAKLLIDKGAAVNLKCSSSRTPLVRAAERGHEAIAKLLVDKGAAVNLKCSSSRTPLLWAAKEGHEAIAKLLVDKGAAVNLKCSSGRTPLSWAAERGHEAIAKLLLDKGAEVNSRDNKYSQTPLLWATESGHKAIAKLLLDRGAAVNSKCSSGRTPLSWVAERGHEAIVKLLVDKGAEVDSRDNKYSQTPLLWAAKSGHEAIAKLLVDKGAEVDSKDIYSRTPLLWAAESGHEAVAKLLLDRGANSKDSSSGRTPLSWVAERGHEAIVKLLVDKGAEVDSRDNRHSQTPLLWAAKSGHEAIAKLLVDKGAEVDARDRYSLTPLLWAVESGHEAITKLLLDRGAAVNLKCSSGRTPLIRAAERGDEAFTKLLVDKGAEVDASDEYSQTPLIWAALEGHEAIAKLLVDKGAAVNLKCSSGRTPLSWAAERGHEAIAKLLLDKGAEVDSKSSSGRTPLSWAALEGHEAIAKLLVDKGAEVDSRDNTYSQTPLSWAAESGYEAVAKLLLDKGAAVNSKCSSGRTPLSWVAERGHEAIAKMLLDKGAEVNLQDNHGQTPLSWAIDSGHEAIAKLLLDNHDR